MPEDNGTYRHPHGTKEKWLGPADHPSDLGESAEAHYEYRLRPNNFCVPPADSQGQSESITVRMQPQMLRVAGIIRDMENSPYTTIGELFRHAVHRHFKWWFAIHPDLQPTYLAMLNIEVQLAQGKEMLAKSEHAGRLLANRVRQLLAEGEDEEAARCVRDLRHNVLKLPESLEKRRMLKDLADEYKELI